MQAEIIPFGNELPLAYRIYFMTSAGLPTVGTGPFRFTLVPFENEGWSFLK
jgi:hypothetical protein